MLTPMLTHGSTIVGNLNHGKRLFAINSYGICLIVDAKKAALKYRVCPVVLYSHKTNSNTNSNLLGCLCENSDVIIQSENLIEPLM